MPALLKFAPRTPYPAELVRSRFQDKARKLQENNPLPDGWQTTTIGVLQSACGGPENRHSVLAYLTGKTSSKALERGAWWALYQWVYPHHLNDKPGDESCPEWCDNQTDTWHCHPVLRQEIANILAARLIEQGQTEMFPTQAEYIPDPHWKFEVA